MLRAAWREVYEDEHPGSVPTAHVITVAAATESSFDLISEFAVPALHIAASAVGPVTNWPRQARLAYAHIVGFLPVARDTEPDPVGGLVHIRMVEGDVNLSLRSLQESPSGLRVERLLQITGSGNIEINIEYDDVLEDGGIRNQLESAERTGEDGTEGDNL